MHVPLSQLLAVGRPPGRSGPIPFSRLACDVAHNAERLRTAACRCGAPVCVDSPYDLLNALVLEPAGLPRLWRFVEALPQGMMGKRRDADLAAPFAKDPET